LPAPLPPPNQGRRRRPVGLPNSPFGQKLGPNVFIDRGALLGPQPSGRLGFQRPAEPPTPRPTKPLALYLRREAMLAKITTPPRIRPSIHQDFAPLLCRHYWPIPYIWVSRHRCGATICRKQTCQNS
jgi:hypothetical protein